MEYKNLIELIQTVSKSNLKEFRYQDGEDELFMSAGKEQDVKEKPIGGVAVQENEKKEELEGKIIKAPLVGTFYRTPSEEASPFVSVGDTVKKGQVLAIVEAMKLMNEIESEFEGKVTEIYPQNGSMVEYGQPLFRII